MPKSELVSKTYFDTSSQIQLSGNSLRTVIVGASTFITEKPAPAGDGRGLLIMMPSGTGPLKAAVANW